MKIRPYRTEDESQVVDLWGKTVGDAAPHNDPILSINMKLKKDPELFLVAVIDDTVVGTMMGGFDGHRGWIYSLAVVPSHRRRGIATQLIRRVEELLEEMGCQKVNLQIRESNSEVVSFYESAGYSVENNISMGKRMYEQRNDR